MTVHPTTYVMVVMGLYFVTLIFRIEKANDALKRIEKKLDSAEKDRVRG